MSKSILVMNTPEACIDCPCHFAEESGKVWCGKEKKELLADDIETYKPDWCPLKEIPRKKPDKAMGEWLDFNCGYNACIHEILKGEE